MAFYPRCRKCRSSAKRKRRSENLMEARANDLAYCARNREKINSQNRRYRQENLVAHRARAIARRKNSETIKIQTKIASDRWRKKNPEKHRILAKAQRAIKRKARIEPVTKKQIDELRVKQRGRCAICKKILELENIDHINPLARGGEHGIKNFQLLCPPCNGAKRASDPIEYMQKLGYLL